MHENLVNRFRGHPGTRVIRVLLLLFYADFRLNPGTGKIIGPESKQLKVRGIGVANYVHWRGADNLESRGPGRRAYLLIRTIHSRYVNSLPRTSLMSREIDQRASGSGRRPRSEKYRPILRLASRGELFFRFCTQLCSHQQNHLIAELQN